MGGIVHVECNNLKRVYWTLVIVEEVMPDSESVVHVVKLRISKGTLPQPIQKLYTYKKMNYMF